MRELPLKGGCEFDALSEWRKFVCFHDGTRKKVKQEYSRRERRFFRKEIKEELASCIAEVHDLEE